MGDVPVEAIRQSQRYEMKLNRRKLKEEESDLRRSIADLQLADVDLPALANKLKNKAKVNVNDLRILKNVLSDNEKNIELVLTTEGALRGLVREISGVDVSRQVEAAACLCNLALADARGCLAITRVAGAYIVAALHSHNTELAITCAWTLGNLSGSGVQASQLVAAAGAVGQLCAMLRTHDAARVHAARSALTLYAHAMGDELSKKHLDLIVHSAGKADHLGAYRLMFILSCHPQFSDPEGLVQSQIQCHFPAMMKEHLTPCVVPSCCELVYAIRTLANMEHGTAYYTFLSFLQKDKEREKDFLDLVKEPCLKTSMLWLLGNMTWRQDHFNQRQEVRGLAERAAEDDGLQRFAAESPVLAEMYD